MSKYSDIEIQTAKNLLKEGYKWIARNRSGRLFAYYEKPIKADTGWYSIWYPIENSGYVCKELVPIFQSVCFDDKEPVSLENIVHPLILDDAEKRYLASVIRPFRDDVLYIEKYSGRFRKVGEFEKVIVDYNYKPLNEVFCFDLPPFEKGAMYKGMKAGQKYTLEELGL